MVVNVKWRRIPFSIKLAICSLLYMSQGIKQIDLARFGGCIFP